MMLHGLPVLGATPELPKILSRVPAQEIIIAMPSAPPQELRRIVELCEVTGLRSRALPGIAQVLAGDASANHVRDVRIEDLLGREPIQQPVDGRLSPRSSWCES